MRIEHGSHRPGTSVSPPNSLPAARANGAVNLVIARRAVASEYLAGRVWLTADAEEEGSGESSSAPGELVARIETGRPVLDWTSLCDRDSANTCGAAYANAWPKAKGVGRKRSCLSLVIITLQRGYYIKLDY